MENEWVRTNDGVFFSPTMLRPVLGRAGRDQTMTGGEHLDLWGFVPPIVHPLKIAVLEALAESDQPLTVGELADRLEGAAGISLVAYHVRTLVQQGAVEEVRGGGVQAALTRYRFRPNQQARR